MKKTHRLTLILGGLVFGIFIYSACCYIFPILKNMPFNVMVVFAGFATGYILTGWMLFDVLKFNDDSEGKTYKGK